MLTLYLTHPVACPLQSGEDEAWAPLLKFYQAQCAQGGKLALAYPFYPTQQDNSDYHASCEELVGGVFRAGVRAPGICNFTDIANAEIAFASPSPWHEHIDEMHIVAHESCPVSCGVCAPGNVCKDIGQGWFDIGAVAMPLSWYSYGHEMPTYITNMTGWGNHFELCCDNDVVIGVSTTASDFLHRGRPNRAEAGETHAAAKGEMVQLTCTDFVDHGAGR